MAAEKNHKKTRTAGIYRWFKENFTEIYYSAMKKSVFQILVIFKK